MATATITERCTRRDAPSAHHLINGAKRFEFRVNGGKVAVRFVVGMVCRESREMTVEEARAVWSVLTKCENYRPW